MRVCFDSLQVVSETAAEGALREQAAAMVLIRIAGMIESVGSSEEGLKAISAGVQAVIQKVKKDEGMKEIMWSAI